MSFPSSCKLAINRGHKGRGGGGAECRKNDSKERFCEKENGISLLSKNDFYFMYLFQIFTEQN